MISKLGAGEEAQLGAAFYAQVDPNLEVSHFATMWRVVSLGHLISTEIDRIARRHGLSGADAHLLGSLRIFGPGPLRATDLALKLQVSNAVLSARIARLERQQLLRRTLNPLDRRSYELTLTPAGAERADSVITEVSRRGRFGRGHASLSPHDQAAVARALSILHETMERDFLPARRGSS